MILNINISLINIAFISNNYKSTRDSCTMANEIVEASNYIESESVVLPILLSDNFIYGHISNYLGTSKPMVITDNYEASLNDFPIVWNCKTMPSLTISGNSIGTLRSDCVFDSKNTKEIDYLVFINDATGNNNNLKKEQILKSLNNQFTLTYKNNFVQIYQTNIGNH